MQMLPRHMSAGTRLTLVLLTLTPLLSGCAASDLLRLLLPEERVVTIVECPDEGRFGDLVPPDTIIDEIDTPEEQAWADLQGRHIEKLAAC